jgi:hypothetical protein
MIIEKQKEAIVLTEGENVEESIGMSLDLDSAQILMQMLSKNLYSDPIGSTIRETVSNSLDSHRRAGVDDHPVLVRLGLNSNNDYEFSTEDFGVGLDDDDVRNIISKYGKSTKRSSNNELGMFGLGFKGPLSYSSSFYFICRKDGIERKYMMYEGEDVNTIDLLYEMPTAERNGVKIIVPVRWGDRETFYNKIKEQLAYFENVYFDVCVNILSINNSFKIHRGEHFQYSELVKDNYLHICLDNVYYPIDFEKLGIAALEFPVGLRFGLQDGIYPTPNRETIRYTQEVKDKILDKLKKVSDFFIEKYNSQIKDCENFEDIINHYTSVKKVKLIEGVELNVGYLSVFSDVNIDKPSMKNVKHLNFRKIVDNLDNVLREYQITHTINRGKIKEVARGWDKILTYSRQTNSVTYLHHGKISEIKKSYIRSLVKDSWTYRYFVKKYSKLSLFGTKTNRENGYHFLLGLGSIPREHWREAIIEFQTIQQGIVDRCIDLDKLDVPQYFIDLHKKNRISPSTKSVRRGKMKGDIIVKLAVPLERYVQGKSCKFVPDTWKLLDIPKMNSLIVYGHHDDQHLLNNLYTISTNKQKIKIISLSTREIDNIKEFQFHNVISYDEFMKGQNKPFKRLITAYLINGLISKNKSTFTRKGFFKSVNKSFYEKLETLENYSYKNYINTNDDIYKAMLEVAESNKLFDYSIYHLYLEMKITLDKLYFINTYLGMLNRYNYNEPSINAIDVQAFVDLFKYHKYKVNLVHYKSNH